MNDYLLHALTLMAGMVLGVIFYGGLWWTVNKSLTARQPSIWIFSSFLTRMSIVLLGLFLMGRDHWQRLLLCFVGFVTARLLVTWYTRSSRVATNHIAQGGKRAS
ncbi:MAG: ATP synthase subunit I [Steroidobacteraceae bacterium]